MTEMPLSRFPEPLKFEDLLFRQIMKVLDAGDEQKAESFVKDIYMLESLVNHWIDKTYEGEVKDLITTGAWRNKEAYTFVECQNADKRFRALMRLICRCGFLPLKEIEVIIE